MMMINLVIKIVMIAATLSVIDFRIVRLMIIMTMTMMMMTDMTSVPSSSTTPLASPPAVVVIEATGLKIIIRVLFIVITSGE